MKFTSSTLFLGLSVVLHSLELISSLPDEPHLPLPTNLISLFPASNNYHFPDIRQLRHDQVENIPGFKKLNGINMCKQAPVYLKRGNVIFGYTKGVRNTGDEEIEPLGRLYRDPYLRAVFHTIENKWYTLEFSELARLGVGRSLPLVLAHDKAHALFHVRNNHMDNEAHDAASAYAYDKTREAEAYLRIGSGSEAERVENVEDGYRTSYNHAYHLYAGGPSGIH